MTVEQLIIEGKKKIHSHEAKMLLASILELDTLELLNHIDDEVPYEKEEQYKEAIKKVIEKKPIQYIIGNVNFYGRSFYINENVLIPRFETEELIYYSLQFIQKNFKKDNLKILDLGCGSGVIGITLAKTNEKYDVTCLDISDEALKVTDYNAKLLNANIKIKKGDMLKNIDEKYDVIISNPPYIAEDEKIEDLVYENEPHIALFGGKDGLKYYDEILKKANKNLKEEFLIAFEIGYTQKEKIIELTKRYLKDIKIDVIKDMSLKDRIILIYKTNS